MVDSIVQLSENDIYGNVDMQLLYVKIFNEFWNLRTKIIGETKSEQTVVTNVTPVAPEIGVQFSVLQ